MSRTDFDPVIKEMDKVVDTMLHNMAADARLALSREPDRDIEKCISRAQTAQLLRRQRQELIDFHEAKHGWNVAQALAVGDRLDGADPLGIF